MVGETVIAIGNAYGYENTVTLGIVSAIGRDVTLNKEVSYKSLIQTDAAINPGNSGGPLINIHGELIGVNVAIRAGAQGIGFAIPVDTMIRVASTMLANQSRSKAMSSGMTVKDELLRQDDNSMVRRLVVDKVEPNGPADKAGLQRGDVLLRVGAQSVSNTLDLERALLEFNVGDKVLTLYRRSGSEQRADIVLSSRTVPEGTDLIWRKFGLRLQNANADAVTRVDAKLHGGMLVTDIRPDSSASAPASSVAISSSVCTCGKC